MRRNPPLFDVEPEEFAGEPLSVQQALDEQSIGTLHRQIGNAILLAASRGKIIALSPATIGNHEHMATLSRTVYLSHQYLELNPGQQPPAGWVLIDPATDNSGTK